MVTEDTCKAQLLYKIQDPLYYNPYVVAVLDGVVIKEQAPNRVYAEIYSNERLLTCVSANMSMCPVMWKARNRHQPPRCFFPIASGSVPRGTDAGPPKVAGKVTDAGSLLYLGPKCSP